MVLTIIDLRGYSNGVCSTTCYGSSSHRSYVSAVTTVAGIKQAGAIGKFNQSVANRNAQIAEQEAAQIEKQKEFDIAKFDQQFSTITRSNKN
jgi:hypothetical protein